MAETKAISSNVNFSFNEQDKNKKCSENYENQLFTDNLCSREDNLGFGHNLANQSKLPLKKRFGTTFENPHFNSMKEKETRNNHLIEKQQTNIRTEEMEQNVEKPEARRVKILPGVIRHTSCPDRYLAYYYNYSVN